jgi:cyanate permease
MIGSFAVGAMMFGSSLSGWLIIIGRAKVLKIAAIIGSIGVTLTLFVDIKMILAGRLMYGFSTGMIAVAMPRYMEESVPPKLVSVFGGLYCFTFAQATILAYFLAYFLP